MRKSKPLERTENVDLFPCRIGYQRYCDEILIEYRDVLFRKKFGFNHETVKILIEELTKRGQSIKPLSSGESFSDPDDAIFYDTMLAKASTANCFLVTGNLRHFPTNPLVLTPRLMVALLEKTVIL